jgi:FkbM family methyltransferase
MTSRFARYRSLVANIRNWPRYFGQKAAESFAPVRFVTRGPSRLRFDVTSKRLYFVFKEVFLADFYRIATLVRSLPHGAVVVDVGANAGFFTMLLLSKRPDARVHAFEPIAGNCELFARNIALNPSLTGSVTLRNAAVTGLPAAEVELYAEADGATSVTASVFADFAAENQRRVRVAAVALAEVLGALGTVGLLKIDCEGSEYPILYETPPNLLKAARAIAMEAHELDADRRNPRAVASYLESLGYRCSAEIAPNGCTALFATLD